MNSKKKLQYEQPKLSIVTFGTNDILTVSNGFATDEDEFDLPKVGF